MHIVITGANRGIGLELTRQYLARGDSVSAGVRSPSPEGPLAALGAAAGGRLRVMPCDVTQDESVQAFAAELDGAVDVLINNAGVRMRPDAIEPVDLESVGHMLLVNAVGALRVTSALLPKLRSNRGARIASISSGLGSIADNTTGGGYGYRMSKAALNMMARSLAQDLRAEGVVSVAISPGWVQTDMGGASAPTTVEESVAGLISLMDRLTPEMSGGFYDFRGETLRW